MKTVRALVVGAVTAGVLLPGVLAPVQASAAKLETVGMSGTVSSHGFICLFWQVGGVVGCACVAEGEPPPCA